MSQAPDLSPGNPAPAPSVHPPTPSPPRARASLTGCLLGLSLVGNLVALVFVAIVCVGLFLRTGSPDESGHYPETFHSGSSTATSRVAIVAIDGVILEGLLGYAHKQIEQAARDSKVKAVVLHVNSPGGSISASEDLHRRIVRLRDGDSDRNLPGKPLVVSMGSIAASGGYYISVPGHKVFAEPTTLTGSIGVYASLPDVTGLEKKIGFGMRIIKAGEIKNAGSPFAALSDKERQVYQDMVNESYSQFLDVISKDREKLTRARLLERFTVRPLRPDPEAADQPPAGPYTRYRADGGVFSAKKARDLGLIDSIGSLDDAVKEAVTLAGLGSWKAIKYHKMLSLTELVFGRDGSPSRQANPGLLAPDRLQNALTPRLWYLAPGHEAAALAAAARAAPSNP